MNIASEPETVRLVKVTFSTGEVNAILSDRARTFIQEKTSYTPLSDLPAVVFVTPMGYDIAFVLRD